MRPIFKEWRRRSKKKKNLTVIRSAVDLGRQSFILTSRKMVALENGLLSEHRSPSQLHHLLRLSWYRHGHTRTTHLDYLSIYSIPALFFLLLCTEIFFSFSFSWTLSNLFIYTCFHRWTTSSPTHDPAQKKQKNRGQCTQKSPTITMHPSTSVLQLPPPFSSFFFLRLSPSNWGFFRFSVLFWRSYIFLIVFCFFLFVFYFFPRSQTEKRGKRGNPQHPLAVSWRTADEKPPPINTVWVKEYKDGAADRKILWPSEFRIISLSIVWDVGTFGYPIALFPTSDFSVF